MTDHRITARSAGESIGVWCKDCVERLDDGYRQSWLLTEINDLAHEHIEASERAEVYRAESTITSEDQLINIETGYQHIGVLRYRDGISFD